MRLDCYCALSVVLCCGLIAKPGLAQNIVLDGTLGPADNLQGPIYIIDQAFGTTVEENLFQSFNDFNLSTGEAAVFTSDPSIQNILSRVTGGNPSSIDGSLLTTSRAVNLFLINPSGILFGPNARLNVGSETRGSFFTTTADGLAWPDDSRFTGIEPDGAEGLLNIVGNPSRFIASQRPLAPIEILGSRPLVVQPGQSLVFLGGDIAVDDSAILGISRSQGGALSLGGLANQGEVELLADGNLWQLRFPEDISRSNVTISGGSSLTTVSSRSGGDLSIFGRDIIVEESSNVTIGIIENGGFQGAQSGELLFDAQGKITLQGAQSLVFSGLGTASIGNVGKITLIADEVHILDGAVLATNLQSMGDIGDILINAKSRIILRDGTAISFANVGAVGDAGNIEINTPILEVLDGARLGSVGFGVGRIGDLLINNSELTLIEGGEISTLVAGPAVSDGGDVKINTSSLVLSEGGQLFANTLGEGNAGNLQVFARDRVLLQGSSFIDGLPLERGVLPLSSAISSNVSGSSAQGDAGDILIETKLLEVLDGAQISTNVNGLGSGGNIRLNISESAVFRGTTPDKLFPSSAVSSLSPDSIGDGGNLRLISSGSLELSEGAQIGAFNAGFGDGGTVSIMVQDDVFLNTESRIFSIVEATASGDGGAVSIETDLLGLTGGSQIIATSEGDGIIGNINVVAKDINISGFDIESGQSSALITPRSFSARGFTNIFVPIDRTTSNAVGGDISIVTENLRLADGALIDARTTGDANAGNINVEAISLTLENGSRILSTTESESGTSGKAGGVQIDAVGNILISGIARDSQLGPPGNLPADSLSASGISVRSDSLGEAGDIRLTGSSLRLTDGGQLIADSNSVSGGNIELILNASLLLDSGGLISATAGNNREPGDGGNINVTTPFLFGLPGSNSDIIANAFQGAGGNIVINSNAILNFRLQEEPNQNILRGNTSNDISASSQFGRSGVLNLAGLNIDPSQGTNELSSELVDSTKLIDRRCELVANPNSRSQFVQRGRWGLPNEPSQSSQDSPFMADLGPEFLSKPDAAVQAAETLEMALPPKGDSVQKNSLEFSSADLLEAEGWSLNEDGKVTLLSSRLARPISYRQPCH